MAAKVPKPKMEQKKQGSTVNLPSPRSAHAVRAENETAAEPHHRKPAAATLNPDTLLVMDAVLSSDTLSASHYYVQETAGEYVLIQSQRVHSEERVMRLREAQCPGAANASLMCCEVRPISKSLFKSPQCTADTEAQRYKPKITHRPLRGTETT
ncbi:hypothetical protein DPX16_17056 [Anabarilius grahami]|uniref:Uncharacterized protein n=1 Tax=Anabarilius grahami TaxID=495550 RepID=A0A3N0YAG6_ANAGA|nr:hypothetical protein DPX16_17056 [Anabarilius grahami]